MQLLQLHGLKYTSFKVFTAFPLKSIIFTAFECEWPPCYTRCLVCGARGMKKRPAIKSLCPCDFCQSKPAFRTDMLPNLGYFIKLLKTIIKTKSVL